MLVSTLLATLARVLTAVVTLDKLSLGLLQSLRVDVSRAVLIGTEELTAIGVLLDHGVETFNNIRVQMLLYSLDIEGMEAASWRKLADDPCGRGDMVV